METGQTSVEVAPVDNIMPTAEPVGADIAVPQSAIPQVQEPSSYMAVSSANPIYPTEVSQSTSYAPYSDGFELASEEIRNASPEFGVIDEEAKKKSEKLTAEPILAQASVTPQYPTTSQYPTFLSSQEPTYTELSSSGDYRAAFLKGLFNYPITKSIPDGFENLDGVTEFYSSFLDMLNENKSLSEFYRLLEENYAGDIKDGKLEVTVGFGYKDESGSLHVYDLTNSESLEDLVYGELPEDAVALYMPFMSDVSDESFPGLDMDDGKTPGMMLYLRETDGLNYVQNADLSPLLEKLGFSPYSSSEL